MFRKYNINECIQKIAFLAMTSLETSFFQTAGEISGNTASSQYFYKGRGLFFICRLLQGYVLPSASDYPETLHLDRRNKIYKK